MVLTVKEYGLKSPQKKKKLRQESQSQDYNTQEDILTQSVVSIQDSSSDEEKSVDSDGNIRSFKLNVDVQVKEAIKIFKQSSFDNFHTNKTVFMAQ